MGGKGQGHLRRFCMDCSRQVSCTPSSVYNELVACKLCLFPRIRQLHGCMHIRIYVWLYVWMDGWMDGWIYIDGWMDDGTHGLDS